MTKGMTTTLQIGALVMGAISLYFTLRGSGVAGVNGGTATTAGTPIETLGGSTGASGVDTISPATTAAYSDTPNANTTNLPGLTLAMPTLTPATYNAAGLAVTGGSNPSSGCCGSNATPNWQVAAPVPAAVIQPQNVSVSVQTPQLIAYDVAKPEVYNGFAQQTWSAAPNLASVGAYN